MCGRIHDERVAAEPCRSIFQDTISICRVLLNHRHASDAVRSINPVQNGIISRAIRTGADRQHSDDRSRIRVQDDQFAATGSEEPAIRNVEGQSRRPSARS